MSKISTLKSSTRQLSHRKPQPRLSSFHEQQAGFLCTGKVSLHEQNVRASFILPPPPPAPHKPTCSIKFPKPPKGPKYPKPPKGPKYPRPPKGPKYPKPPKAPRSLRIPGFPRFSKTSEHYSLRGD